MTPRLWDGSSYTSPQGLNPSRSVPRQHRCALIQGHVNPYVWMLMMTTGDIIVISLTSRRCSGRCQFITVTSWWRYRGDIIHHVIPLNVCRRTRTMSFPWWIMYHGYHQSLLPLPRLPHHYHHYHPPLPRLPHHYHDYLTTTTTTTDRHLFDISSTSLRYQFDISSTTISTANHING